MACLCPVFTACLISTIPYIYCDLDGERLAITHWFLARDIVTRANLSWNPLPFMKIFSGYAYEIRVSVMNQPRPPIIQTPPALIVRQCVLIGIQVYLDLASCSDGSLTLLL